MKQFTITFLLLTLLSFLAVNNKAKTSPPVWNENLDQAVEIAKKQGKGILINFTGSDWCQWCKKLDAEVFSQQEFINYANTNLVLVKIDFPQYKVQTQAVKEYNMQLAMTFRISGYPTIVLINKRQEVVAYTGYQEGGAAKYVKYLKSVFN